MKKSSTSFIAIIALLLITACSDQVVVYENETFTADGVSFDMVYVPAGGTFPTGVNDDAGDATVEDDYWIADSEVTYLLWWFVYEWAVNNSYFFANNGNSEIGEVGEQYPVRAVNWRDSMVWCNALTEWYNAQQGTTYSFVYSYLDGIIRDSRDSNATVCDAAVANPTADGFRLLTNNEWEYAARYRDGVNWTYGDHVSGDESGACYDDGSILGGLGISTVFGEYTVYNNNSEGSAEPLKSKTPNALGIYNMSGNASEWCFDKVAGSLRSVRGGSYNSQNFEQRIGGNAQKSPDYNDMYIGFRIARTQ